VSFHVVREHSHDFKSVVTLQNCMAILRDELGSYQTSSGDGNQFLFVNAEEFTDIEVEEDPSTSAVIKPEPAVSCVSVYVALYIVGRYPVLPVTLPVCLSVHRIICTLVNAV